MKRLIFVLTAVFAFAGSVYAQSDKTVSFTVSQAVDYALKNSRSLKSADIDLAIKERAAKYSWNVFLPNVQVSGTMSRQNNIDSQIDQANSQIDMMNMMMAGMGVPPSKHTSATESMHWAAVGNVGVSLNLSLAYIEQIKASKSAYEGGKISWEQTRLETKTNIKKLFYGLLLQQENIKVKKASLEDARRRSVQARENWENGLAPELTYLRAYVAYENLKPEVSDCQRMLNQQLDTFAFLLGLPVGSKIELVGSVEPVFIEVDADNLLIKYSGNSLDLQSLILSKENLQHNLKAVNLGSMAPSLSLNWGYQPMLTDPANKSWGSSDNWKDNGAFSATILWNLTNLLPCSSSRVQAKDLQDNIRKIDISMETVRENQKMEVRKSVDTITSAREQMDAMTRSINLAQRSYQTLEASYQAGTTELMELRDAESQLNQAKLGLLNQKYNYITAILDLEKILNVDLGVIQ